MEMGSFKRNRRFKSTIKIRPNLRTKSKKFNKLF